MPALAEGKTETELPDITVQSTPLRAGTVNLVPEETSTSVDTADVLKRVPGANVARNGALTGLAQYRGLTGNRVNVSVDGIDLKEVGPNSMDPPLSHIPAALTGNVQVRRGIAPVSSGIQTLGGSIQTESRRGRFAEGDGIETSGAGTIGYGSAADGHFGALLGAVANKNHKLYLSGSREQGRDYTVKNNDKQVPTQYKRDVITTGYAYQRDGHEFGINYSNNDTSNTGTPSLPMDIIYIRGGVYDAKYSFDFGNGYQLKTHVFYQNMRHLMNNFSLRGRLTNITPANYRQNRTNLEAGGWDAVFSMPFYQGNLRLGINGDQASHDARITNPNNAAFFVENFQGIERDRYSLFSEWDGNLWRDISAEFGLRLTYGRSNAGNVASSITLPPARALAANFNGSNRLKEDFAADIVSILHYTPDEHMQWEFGLARKNRLPSYQERYLWIPLEATSGLADGRNYIGDINLDLETAYQIEFGFNWNKDRFRVAPRAFYHYIHNYIQGVAATNTAANMVSLNNSGTPALQFTNIEAQLYGADVEAGYTIDKNWFLDAGLSYVRGERVDAKDNLYRIAPLNGRLQLNYENSGWKAAIEGVFYASQGDVSRFNNELKTPGYALLNLRGSYEPIRGLVVSTGIENVTDQKHFNHLGGIDRVNLAVSGDRTRVALPGRNYYATLSYHW